MSVKGLPVITSMVFAQPVYRPSLRALQAACRCPNSLFIVTEFNDRAI